MSLTMLRRVAAALALALFCSKAAASQVTVFAAASLMTALEEIASDYTAATGRPVVASYAGTSTLARQIMHGAPADAFVAANAVWMDAVAAKGLIDPSTRVDLLGNRLALVGHGDVAPATIDPNLDLAAMLGEGRLAMALVEGVPAGVYGRLALENLGLWETVAPRVAQADNVRAALALVAVGAAPLGVVYATDAMAEPRVSVIGLFPEATHPRIVYPAAALSARDEAAAAFVAHLRSPDARAVFEREGFAVLVE